MIIWFMVGLPKHDLMRAARSLYYSRAMIVPIDQRLTPQALVDLFIPPTIPHRILVLADVGYSLGVSTK
jgi:hypothetical protein